MTELNPSAPSFTPNNRCFEDKCNEKVYNISTDLMVGRSLTSTADRLTTASTSGSNDKKYKSKTKTKPSVLTLEQFITEKLKIEDKSKKVSKTDPKIQKKVQTIEMPYNPLDSSSPTKYRGKERVTPKRKKPSFLKKIIINEKNSNQENCDQKESLNKYLDEMNGLENLNNDLIHSKTYREYCCQRLTKDIDQLVVHLLTDLVFFQDRLYSRDPNKAKIKKRLCFGFKEVTKYAKINKIKLLVIAPDIDKIESTGGLDDSLSTLIAISRSNATPIVFALSRHRLGITSKKKGCVSCIAVLNYDGSNDNFKQLISLCETERKEYKSICIQSMDKLKALPTEEVQDIINGLPDIPQEFLQFRDMLDQSDRRSVKLKKIFS